MISRRDVFLVAGGLAVGAIVGLGAGERWIGLVALCAAMLACACGIVIGAQAAGDALVDQHARALALATNDAERTGYLRGWLEAHEPAPAGAPYDWNDGR